MGSWHRRLLLINGGWLHVLATTPRDYPCDKHQRQEWAVIPVLIADSNGRLLLIQFHCWLVRLVFFRIREICEKEVSVNFYSLTTFGRRRINNWSAYQYSVNNRMVTLQYSVFWNKEFVEIPHREERMLGIDFMGFVWNRDVSSINFFLQNASKVSTKFHLKPTNVDQSYGIIINL